jgi:hypothetical protein
VRVEILEIEMMLGLWLEVLLPLREGVIRAEEDD